MVELVMLSALFIGAVVTVKYRRRRRHRLRIIPGGGHNHYRLHISRYGCVANITHTSRYIDTSSSAR